MRLLVVGDSFGTLDPVHSHWLRLWAESQGGTTEHCAIKGSNHVNIVSEFFNSYSLDSLREFNGLVYFVTDYLRSESISRHPRVANSDVQLEHPTLSRIKVCDPTDSLYVSRWNWLLSGELDIPAEIDWPQTHHIRPVLPWHPGDQIENNLFYYNISLRWLIRANFNSARSVILAAQSAGLPVCMIRTAWNQGYYQLEDVLPGISTWHQPRKFTVTDPDISNHVNRDNAMEIAELWQETAIDTGVFTPKTISPAPPSG
jgi:hypothetical protein